MLRRMRGTHIAWVYLAKAVVAETRKLRILLRGFLQRLAKYGHPIAFAVDKCLNSLL